MNYAEQLHTIFVDCLFTKEELQGLSQPPEGAILVEGIVRKYGFEPSRIKKHEEEILTLANTIVTDDFLEDHGGGMTFLNLCNDREGNQWGEHRSMEQLLCLCSALGRAKILLPRAMWPSFPGGVPYISFKLNN